MPQVRVRTLDVKLGSKRRIDHATLADAMYFLKLSIAKQLREFRVKLLCLQRNSVKRAGVLLRFPSQKGNPDPKRRKGRDV